MPAGIATPTSGGKNSYGAGIVFEAVNVDETIKQIEKLQAATAGLENSMVNMGQAFGPMQDQASQTTAAASAQSLAMMEQGRQLKAWGQGILGTLFGWGRGLAQVGGQFEDVRTQLKLAFEKEGPGAAKKAFNEALKVAESTNLLTTSVLKSVADMKRKGIDALKTYEKLTNVNGIEKKQILPALQLMSDLVVGSGQAAENVQYHMNFAVTGTMRSFRAIFDGREKVEERAAYKSAKTNQERFDVINKIIMRLYGGLSAAAESNFSYLMDNIGDVMQNLKGLLGEGLLKSLNPALKAVFDWLAGLKENEAFMKSMQKLMTDIGNIISSVVLKLKEWGDWFVKVAAAHPWLIKLGIAVAGINATLLVVAGSVLIFTGAFKAFALNTIPQIVAGVKAAAVAMGGWTLVIGAVIVAGYVLYKAYQNNFGGLKDFIDSITLGIKGLWALMTSWKDDTASMPRELRNALADAGMLDWVVRVGGWLGRIKQFVFDVWDAFKGFLVGMKDALAPALRGLFELLGSVGRVIGAIFDALTGVDATDLSGVRKEVKAVQLFFKWLSDAAMEVGLTLERVFAHAAGWLEDNKEVIVDVGRIVLQVVRVALDALWRSLEEGYRITTEEIGPALSDIITTFKETYNLIIDAVVPALSDFVDMTMKVVSALGLSEEAAGKFKQEIDWMRVAAKALSYPIDLIAKGLKAISLLLNQIGRLAKDTFAGFQESIDGMIKVYEYFKEAFLKGWEVMKAVFAGDLEAMKPLFDDFWDHVKDGFFNMIKTMVQEINPIVRIIDYVRGRVAEVQEGAAKRTSALQKVMLQGYGLDEKEAEIYSNLLMKYKEEGQRQQIFAQMTALLRSTGRGEEAKAMADSPDMQRALLDSVKAVREGQMGEMGLAPAATPEGVTGVMLPPIQLQTPTDVAPLPLIPKISAPDRSVSREAYQALTGLGRMNETARMFAASNEKTYEQQEKARESMEELSAATKAVNEALRGGKSEEVIINLIKKALTGKATDVYKMEE